MSGHRVLGVRNVHQVRLASVLWEPKLGAFRHEKLVCDGVAGNDGNVAGQKAVEVDLGVLDLDEGVKGGAVEAAGDVHLDIVLEGDGPAAVGAEDVVHVGAHAEDVNDEGGGADDALVNGGGEPRDPEGKGRGGLVGKIHGKYGGSTGRQDITKVIHR